MKPGLFYKHLCHSVSDRVSQSSFVKISSKHLHSQTVRARELKFWFTSPYMLCVMCHISSVPCHMSYVTCHVWHDTCHLMQLKKNTNPTYYNLQKFCHSQTVRSRDLKVLNNFHHPPHYHHYYSLLCYTLLYTNLQYITVLDYCSIWEDGRRGPERLPPLPRAYGGADQPGRLLCRNIQVRDSAVQCTVQACSAVQYSAL